VAVGLDILRSFFPFHCQDLTEALLQTQGTWQRPRAETCDRLAVLPGKPVVALGWPTAALNWDAHGAAGRPQLQ